MLSILKKIGILFITLGVYLGSTSCVFAQSNIEDPLPIIKSRTPGIIDYASPEGEWGQLSTFWVKVLMNIGETSLVSFIEENDYEGDFFQLANLKRDLGKIESEKTQAETQDEIDEFDIEIQDIKDQINGITNPIKADIKSRLGEATDPKLSNQQKEEGKEVIFAEIEYYFNYKRWGTIPERLQERLITAQYKTIDELSRMDNDTLEAELRGIGFTTEEVQTIMDAVTASHRYGERQINAMMQDIAIAMRNLIGGLAVIWIIISAIRMIMAQGDESVLTEQKRSILYAIIGLMAIILVERAINIIYGAPGANSTQLVPQQRFDDEVYGLVAFIKALAGTIAIFMIVVSGIRTLMAMGQEDEISKQRKSLLYIAIGMILLLIDKIIVEQIFIVPTQNDDQIRTSNITTVINTFGGVMKFILGFIGIVALGILVYGAALMTTNYGNEEAVENAKKIIKNAIIGIIVIISAYTIVATLIVFK